MYGHEDLDEKQAEYVDRFFQEEIYPVVTPMAVDSSRPFPLIRNKSLNIGALLRKKNGGKKDEIDFATVQVPAGMYIHPLLSQYFVKSSFVIIT